MLNSSSFDLKNFLLNFTQSPDNVLDPELPVWIKKDINPPIKMKFNFKNEISITIPYTTWLSENTIINYILETKNLDQKKEIVQALKSWM